MPERVASREPVISLPFPPSSLSGHNTGHWRAKSAIVKQHRAWAYLATLEAQIPVPDEGPIQLSVTFTPPDNRGDPVNYINRCKPYFDGIADALGVNDKRFRPNFEWAEPRKPGGVSVCVL